MQGLLQKLADLDSDAERGVRLIEFFDQLVVHGADLEAVVRATAVLAQCAVGAAHDEGRSSCVVGLDGSIQPGRGPSATAMTAPVRVDDVEIGRVWLERADVPKQWDDLILDRMALTVASTVSRKFQSPPVATELLGLSDPAIVQVALDPDASEVERSRAIRLLGFAPGQRVDVAGLQVAGDMPRILRRLQSHLAEKADRHAVSTALSDSLGILIIGTGAFPTIELGPDLRCCVAQRVGVESIWEVWHSVRQGVRFAALEPSWPSIVKVADLGSLVLLADLPPAVVLASEDVCAVDRIVAQPGGSLDLHLLRALCTSKSLREAAQEAHMHHSSVAYRLSRSSKAFGFDVRAAHNRYRLSTALLLWGLHSPNR